MAITTAMCTSFKVESWKALHDFTVTTGHLFKMALYAAAAVLDKTTTVYSATNEVLGAGYTAGGKDLVNISPVADGTGSSALLDFPDVAWTVATISAAGAMIYNSNGGANRAVCVLDFGGVKVSTAGTFTVVFPAPALGTAILQLT